MREALITVTLALAACGSDGGGSGPADASTADATSPTDAEGSGSTCGVQAALVPGEAVPTWTVVFSAADGSFIGTSGLDTTGLATRDDCLADTIVSIAGTGLFDGGDGADVATYFGVGRNTILHFDPMRRSVNGAAGSLEIATAHTSEPPGAASYLASLGCSNVDLEHGATQTVELASACLDTAGRVSVLAMALDNRGAPIRYDSAVDVAASSVTLNAWRNPASYWLQVSDSPSDLAAVGLAFFRNGILYDQRGQGNPTISGGKSNTTIWGPPMGFADTVRVGAETLQDHSWQGQVVWRSPAMILALDGTKFPPRVTSASLDWSAAARPVLTWEAEGPLDTLDFGSFAFSWSSNTGTTNQVRLVFPPTGVSPKLPELPDDLAAYRIPAGAFATVPLGTFVDLAHTMSYAEALVARDANAVAHAGGPVFPVGRDYRSTSLVDRW